MSSNTSTFKRYEKKFMLTDSQYEQMKKGMNDYMIPDKFDKYTICNIYYDTTSYEIIRRSIEKPVYKEKLRVRYYGDNADNHTIFFELKKKYKHEVFKRRVSMSADEYENYFKNGEYPNVPKQIMDEIAYFISVYNPEPKIFIAYDRLAFIGKEDKSVRITFDENIRYRNVDLLLGKGDYGKKILDKSKHLMEIKISGAMPLWLSHLFNELQIYSTSFSKYGYCYTNYILNNSNSDPVSEDTEIINNEIRSLSYV